MTRKTAFLYHDSLSRHSLSESHPLKPLRLRYTFELLEAYGVFNTPQSSVVSPRAATDEELLRFHTPPYLDAVQRLSRGEPEGISPETFGLGPGDNPIYEGMYEASAMSAGASMKAVELLASGEVDSAFNISGGLHHAMPSFASGFCVFNDPVIAIKALLLNGMKVAYVDIDCHHGDGVQQAFYDSNDVLTISIHESGAFLFPGTGFAQETGEGKGHGYSVNIPLYPYTGDDVYLWALKEIVPPLLEAYNADILVTQLGIDSHFLDPITHLGLTVQGFESAVQELAAMAPRWLALGGGGYDVETVARAWSLAFSVMSGQKLADEIPNTYRTIHNVSSLRDSNLPNIEGAQKTARTFAEQSVQAVRQMIFPVHGLKSYPSSSRAPSRYWRKASGS